MFDDGGQSEEVLEVRRSVRAIVRIQEDMEGFIHHREYAKMLTRAVLSIFTTIPYRGGSVKWENWEYLVLA